jgi:CrcB protein
MKNILLVGLGGGIGSIARYLSQRWFAANFASVFPWGTWTVNVAGCFLIGLLWGLSFRSDGTGENWKLFLMTGLCGGFTTFSAFTMEGIGLMREQKTGLFFMYIAASVITGLLATYAGLQLTK